MVTLFFLFLNQKKNPYFSRPSKKKNLISPPFLIVIAIFSFFQKTIYTKNNISPCILATKKELAISYSLEHNRLEYFNFEKQLKNLNAQKLKQLLFQFPQIGPTVEEESKKENSNDNKPKKSVGDLNKIVTILKKINQQYLEYSAEKTNFIKKFLHLIEYYHEQKPDERISKNIYHALLSISGNDFFINNEDIYNTQRDFNLHVIADGESDSLRCILWIFYIFNELEEIFTDSNEVDIDDYLALYAYPIINKKKELTFQKIQINKILLSLLVNMKTSCGREYLPKALYVNYVNEKNAYIEISKMNIFTELLMDEENEEVKKIKKGFDELATIEKKMSIIENGHTTTAEFNAENNKRNFLYKLFDIKRQPLAQYLSEFIPNIPFMQCNKYSHKFFYIGGSFLQFAVNGWSNHASNISTMISKYFPNDPNSQKISPFENMSLVDNPLTRMTPGISLFMPFYSNTEAAKKINSYNTYPYLTQDFLDEKTGAMSRYQGFTLSDTLLMWKNTSLPLSQKTFGQIAPTVTLVGGTVFHFGKEIIRIFTDYKNFRSMIYQFESVKNFYTYFNLLNDLITKSRELFKNIETLYTSKNLPVEWMPSICTSIKNLFSHKNKRFKLVKRILNNSKNIVKKTTNYIFNFFAPGIMAHFYFNDLEESKEIEMLNNFISLVDMTFAKIALINYSKNKNSKISFCIPKILNPDEQKDIVLQAKNICYPIINNNIIKNSISLDKNNRNMLIVSPVAGGKTVFLSTLLSSLYLANLGIVPGEEFTYTYFSAIIDHLEHRYNIGSGLSQHLAERQSMQELKHLTQVDNRKKIVIIDEIYKGTIPTLAVQEALLDLPPILLKDNIVTIITTHFPEITKIVENTDYALKLYYLKVNHFSGIFEKTFKLYLDDQDNWWIRDFSLALKYQLSQKK